MKVKAFTLSEMLVVLVVSSLVIALAFSVLSMVRKQVITIQENYRLKQELRFFELNVIRDINTNSVTFSKNEGKLVLKGINDNIVYQFLDSVVIRKRDTLHISIKNKTLFLDGKVVQEGTIDAMELEVSFPFPNQTLFVQQQKDATYYLNK